MTISLSVLLRMRNVSDKSGRENQNTHFTVNNPPENRVIYEIKWKNIVEPERPQRQRGACTLHAEYLRLKTLSELVILIAFPLQQWLQVRALTLRYIYVDSLSCWSIVVGLVVSPEEGSCLSP